LTILAYISGHGFGHWTRSSALLERLSAERAVHVRTAGRTLTLARRASWASSVEPFDVGTGVAQLDPLRVDVSATRVALEAHLAGWDPTADAGAHEARALGADLIYGDVPPVAFEIARRASLPSVAMANFSWSWAYAHYASQDPFFAGASERLRAAEGLATQLIALPGGGGLDAFPRATPELALRRRPTCTKAEAQDRLDELTGRRGRPVVVCSFGGFGDLLDLSAGARANPELTFLSFATPRGEAPENLTTLPQDHGLAHQDLVLGADALVAKPGYGTVSECMNGPTPLAYVLPSGEFREHAHLVRMIERWLPAASLSVEALLAGQWSAAIEAARAAASREEPPPDGLDEAFAAVLAVLAG
jgi:hypothetical protein